MKTSILLILISCGLIACSKNHSDSNRLDSYNYENKEERIKLLSNAIKLFSTITDAEFNLFNVNGFSNQRTTVPGSSSLNYKFVVKIIPENINKWTDGFIKSDSLKGDIRWTSGLIKNRMSHWPTNSNPEYYYREGEDVEMVIYRTEGIIFKKVVME